MMFYFKVVILSYLLSNDYNLCNFKSLFIMLIFTIIYYKILIYFMRDENLLYINN